jgi:hypothetical protein
MTNILAENFSAHASESKTQQNAVDSPLEPILLDDESRKAVDSRRASIYKQLKPWQTRILELAPDRFRANIRANIRTEKVQRHLPDNLEGPVLSLFDGEMVSDIELLDADWWRGTNERGQRGIFPKYCVSRSAESAITCKLLPVDIIDSRGLAVVGSDSTITYEALSYAWGDPTPTCLIEVNGKEFGIARELANALLYLKDKTKARYLWCDALCINQADLVEKGYQVKNMLRVFEKAEKVIAWLGVPHPDSYSLFWALHNWRLTDGVPKHLAITRDAFDDLLISPWFSRTWVRQEVFAAKKMFIRVGRYQVDFEKVAKFSRRAEKGLYEKPSGSDFPDDSSITSSDDSALISWHDRYIPPTLGVFRQEYQHYGTDRNEFEVKATPKSYTEYCVSVLRSGALFQATIEQDRVYGVLGLLTSPSARFLARLPENLDASLFPIDYSKSLSEVYQDVTKFLINTTRTLEILEVLCNRRYLKGSGLPSWATDWDHGREEFKVSYFNMDLHKPPKLRSQPAIQKYDNAGELKLRGRLVAGKLVSLDTSKYLRRPHFDINDSSSCTLKDVLIGPTPSCILLTRTEELKESVCMRNITSKPSWTSDQDLVAFLAGPNYAFASVERDFDAGTFLLQALLVLEPPDQGTLNGRQFLVPSTASLDDVLVSFDGSLCLHLLSPEGNGRYRYVGPVVLIVVGEDYTSYYSSNVEWKFPEFDPSQGPETFVIV